MALIPRRLLSRFSRVIALLLLTFVFVAGTVESQATLYQTININVMSAEVFRIGRKEYPMAELTAVVLGEIRGTNRIMVEIFLPMGIGKKATREIKEQCRKAGATSFTIAYKS
jgi:hypothetical protein